MCWQTKGVEKMNISEAAAKFKMTPATSAIMKKRD
jgi:hypothetical protein